MQNISCEIPAKCASQNDEKAVRRLRISAFSFTPAKPFIRLHGYWLQQAGFHVADEIDVHVLDQRLVITPVSKLIARCTVKFETRRNVVGHSAELPAPALSRIILPE